MVTPFVLSMSQRVVPTKLQDVIGNVCHDVFEILSLGEPSEPLTPALFHDTVYAAFVSHWEEVPDEPRPARPAVSTASQCGMTGSHVWVPMPDSPIPIRCASNTLTNGQRCKLPAYYPYTLCATHYRFLCRHQFLPDGGATAAYLPHPQDVWKTYW